MKRVVARATREERRTDRRVIGPLSVNIVTPLVLKRYAASFSLFMDFVTAECGGMPQLYEQLDRFMVSFLEQLWHDGESRSVGSHSVAGLQ